MKQIDGFHKPPHDTSLIWETVKEYFDVKDHLALVDMFYRKFDKPFLSGLCKKIAELANGGDLLSKYIFRQAGSDLARSIAAVMRKASPKLLNQPGGVHVLCVGSVWLSWNLLKEGFDAYLGTHEDIAEMSLLRIKTVMAVGAAYMAADKYNIPLPRDYLQNYEIFYTYNRDMLHNSD